jgi:hypothetical protein
MIDLEKLREIARTLNSTLGDTDPYFDDNMTDDDIRDESPVWWAARELNIMLDTLKTLAAQPAAAGVPEGWVPVPRGRTDAMDEAAMLALCGSIGGYEAGCWANAWDAALAAAPQPEAKAESLDESLDRTIREINAEIQPEPAGREAVAVVGERGSVSWRSETILPIGTKLYTSAPPVADADVLNIAGCVGVYYYNGKVNLGAPLFAFTRDEMIAFARRLTGSDHGR